MYETPQPFDFPDFFEIFCPGYVTASFSQASEA
jgi:hypothetical protein